MGLPGKCYYVGQVGEAAQALGGVLSDFFTSGWEPLVRGGIDGYNISDSLIDKRCGLEWHQPPPGSPPGPKKLCAPALSDTQVPAMRRKGPSGSNRKYGLELVVDPANPTYSKVCVVTSTDLTKQIISFVPQDPKTATNPTGSVLANYGKGIFGTSGAFDWELHRNSAASLTDDGTAIGTTREQMRLGTLASSASFPMLKRSSTSVQVKLADDSAYALLRASTLDIFTGLGGLGSGVSRLDSAATASRTATFQDATGTVAYTADITAAVSGTSGKVTRFTGTNTVGNASASDDGTTLTAPLLVATADATLGNVKLNKTTQTASSAGTYAVAATIGLVFIAAAALTAAQNFNITLPIAATYPARHRLQDHDRWRRHEHNHLRRLVGQRGRRCDPCTHQRRVWRLASVRDVLERRYGLVDRSMIVLSLIRYLQVISTGALTVIEVEYRRRKTVKANEPNARYADMADANAISLGWGWVAVASGLAGLGGAMIGAILAVYAQGKADGLRAAEVTALRTKVDKQDERSDKQEERISSHETRLVSMDKSLAVVASNMANLALSADKTARTVEKIWERSARA